MAEYFSTLTHEDSENLEPQDQNITSDALLKKLQEGHKLHKPEHIKIAITTATDGSLILALNGETIPTKPLHKELIEQLGQNKVLSVSNIDGSNQDSLMTFVTNLYNQKALKFKE